MLFNEILEKIFTYSYFSRSAKKEMGASGFGLKVMLVGSFLFQFTVNYVVPQERRSIIKPQQGNICLTISPFM